MNDVRKHQDIEPMFKVGVESENSQGYPGAVFTTQSPEYRSNDNAHIVRGRMDILAEALLRRRICPLGITEVGVGVYAMIITRDALGHLNDPRISILSKRRLVDIPRQTDDWLVVMVGVAV